MQNKLIKNLLGGLLIIAFTFSPINTEAKVKVGIKKVIHVCKRKDIPVYMLACAMYAEGRGEGETGMALIGNVILNRSSSDNFPDTIHSVVYQKGQFTYINKYSIKIKDKKSWESALSISIKLLYLDQNFPEVREASDKTKGSTYYKRWDVRASWTKDMKVAYRYKNHVFYKERHK